MKNKMLSFIFLMALVFPALSSASTCVDLRNNLVLGSTDKKTKGEVTKLQKFLNSRVNGLYDLNTATAVWNFKKKNNLPAKGYADKKLREIIKVKTCSITISNDEIIINRPPQNPNISTSGVIINADGGVTNINEITITTATTTTSTSGNLNVTIPTINNSEINLELE